MRSGFCDPVWNIEGPAHSIVLVVARALVTVVTPDWHRAVLNGAAHEGVDVAAAVPKGTLQLPFVEPVSLLKRGAVRRSHCIWDGLLSFRKRHVDVTDQ